ncbi:1-deoxy-D-xylulose-5-phosphate reductoisomerase [Sphingomonas lacunae]|uniref:1-deoxy-D-xylulose 5-phosphate reductoisomerase n=2 Tax=Sphingomonas lacunae TaxID=2698828 RepID=A0A6M4B197_9SPHN|nr:1-deoxy-D-xylulose-5-phosphate reductoisomerase [Sphingomonas lacunae]
MMRSISIFGATGSVGQSTLDLVRRNRDEWRVVALTANGNVAELAALAREFRPEVAVVADAGCEALLAHALAGEGIAVAAGEAALVEAAKLGADVTMAAIVGCAGLAPTMAAIECGKTVALANKESLVAAGELMMAAARASGATILPVDSEHNAIFQCLSGDLDRVAKITLTASGGPFRTFSHNEMGSVTPEQAVAHPNWSMGAKISVDSATMMNKGLELIEAYHLFPVGLARLDIIVHPQSVVHSMVEYVDGSTIAQLGPADMRVPIASALAWPDRMATPCSPLDLAKLARLEFEAPDFERFPALTLARAAIAEGGGRPAQLNAANEVAVAAFLDRRIGFLDIAAISARLFDETAPIAPHSLHDVFNLDRESRARAEQLVVTFAKA